MKKGSRSHKRKLFNQDEDKILLDLVEEYGENWILIARRMDARNPRQCKDRYLQYLSPTVNVGPWTVEEDNLLIEKQRMMGKNWVEISKFFKSRTDTAIKNRFQYLLKKGTLHESRQLENRVIQPISESRTIPVDCPQRHNEILIESLGYSLGNNGYVDIFASNESEY